MNSPIHLWRTLPMRPIASFTSCGAPRTFATLPAVRFAKITTPSTHKPTCTPMQSLLIRANWFPISRALPSSQRRLASTTTPVIDTTSTTTASPAPGTPLPWNRFLALRKQRRRISLIASILGGITGMVTGVAVLVGQDVEALGAAFFGFDPTTVMGLATLACFGLGWLLGPFLGNAVFNFWNRGLRGQIAARERDFFAKIKKYRVDPSSSSMANPIPDYYGEKIGSVADYRRWLKDQRAFNLKRGKL